MSAKTWALALALGAASAAQAGDWPMWGRTPERNMAADAGEKGLPVDFAPGRMVAGTEQVDVATAKGLRWAAKLGSQSYGNLTVDGGRIFIGTNNEAPRNPAHKGDRGIVMCLDEQTGAFQWQLVVPKLGAGKVSDWEFLGICSSPHVEGNRVYVVTNRCEVVCLDVAGQANGNDGPFTDEAQYAAGPGNKPIPVGPTDADLIWRVDMREEGGVFPHNITSSSVLVIGDRVYVNTSNGQDWSHKNVPSPTAPTLLAFDRQTGALVGEEALGISHRLFHSSWASPAFGQVGDRGLLIFGAGDGFCYGLDPVPVKGADDINTLKEVWRFDCNPPSHKVGPDGKPRRYPDPQGASEVIATPVFHEGRVYVAVGQDPEHGDGVGNLSCIDASGSGDLSTKGKLWTYDKISRSISTVALAGDLVFAADYAGYLHCLDAKTGAVHWTHNTGSHIWGSPLLADGKVYLGNEDGVLTIFAATKAKQVLGKVEFPAPLYASPVAANGVLYVNTPTHLYAFGPAAK